MTLRLAFLGSSLWNDALQYCLEGICYEVTAESKGLPGAKPCPCEKTRHESGNTSYFAKK
jgi:hypothetical protein